MSRSGRPNCRAASCWPSSPRRTVLTRLDFLSHYERALDPWRNTSLRRVNSSSSISPRAYRSARIWSALDRGVERAVWPGWKLPRISHTTSAIGRPQTTSIMAHSQPATNPPATIPTHHQSHLQTGWRFSGKVPERMTQQSTTNSLLGRARSHPTRGTFAPPAPTGVSESRPLDGGPERRATTTDQKIGGSNPSERAQQEARSFPRDKGLLALPGTRDGGSRWVSGALCCNAVLQRAQFGFYRGGLLIPSHIMAVRRNGARFTGAKNPLDLWLCRRLPVSSPVGQVAPARCGRAASSRCPRARRCGSARRTGRACRTAPACA